MNETVTIRWLGHSCFRITWRERSLIVDPYADGYVPGLPPLREKADAVYCSHSHGDHGAAELITLSGRGMPEGFSVQTYTCPHDHHGGTKRGMNVIHVFDFGGLRVVHMGDVGTTALEEDAFEAVYGCDALLIPIGGHYTISAGEAKTLVDKIAPRVTVPMHYRSAVPAFGFGVLSTADAFLERFDESEVLLSDSPEFRLTTLSPKVVVVPAFPFK